MGFLVGYKTYIVAAALVLNVLNSFVGGEITVGQAINESLTGFGLAALRIGVASAK